MTRNFWTRQLPVAVLITGTVIATVAWQTHPGKSTHTTNDTIPDRHKKAKDIDEALAELDKGRAEMEKSLKEIDWKKIQVEISASMKDLKIETDQMKIEIANALKELDLAKIQAEVQKSIREIDFDKIQAEIQKSVAEIDVQKIKAEIDKSIKEIDVAKIKAEIDASISKIDMDKIKVEMDRIKDIDFKKMEEEMKKIGPEIEKSMEGAREGIEQARKELTAYKSLIDGLDRDGLINKKENYKIEYKSGELTINGKKQSADLVRKYQDILKGRKDFTIKKDKDDFDIDND